MNNSEIMRVCRVHAIKAYKRPMNKERKVLVSTMFNHLKRDNRIEGGGMV